MIYFGTNFGQIKYKNSNFKNDEIWIFFIDPEIEEMWKLIDTQIKNYTNNNLKNKSDENKGLKVVKRFKVIRVFVSSTFTDFFNEREVLVKQVE